MVVVRLEGISKTYVVRTKVGRFRRSKKLVRAVQDVSLTIEAGEMVGYLGPNGAGKSTTIKMITGILQPTGGSIEVLGLVPVSSRVKLARRLGVVFGQRSQLWWDLPLNESFDLLHHLYRTDKARHEENLASFVDRLDMGSFLTTPVRQLSLGQRMRGELTAAFLHDPELVVLDEPTIGLDVVSKYEVRQFLQETNRENGTTVLLTTHDLDDVEQLCERMLVIDEGQVILDGRVDDFKAEYGTDRVLIVDLFEAEAAMQLGDSTVTKVEGPRQWIQFDRRKTSAAALITEISDGRQIRDLTIEEPAIEDLIRRVYRRETASQDSPD